ncbi:hypothetical protein, partial [Flavobacterium sp.]|uniref:hypothetical protein n=1 Tax=Flavobacterium sp. TaxID=239 RepID=UPI002635C121
TYFFRLVSAINELQVMFATKIFVILFIIKVYIKFYRLSFGSAKLRHNVSAALRWLENRNR